MTEEKIKKTPIQKEEKTSDITIVETQRKELSGQINNLLSNLAEVKAGIGTAEKQKMVAKEDYQKQLDKGDENGMKKALAQIRSSNSQRENLINSLSGFNDKITELRTAHSELLSQARNNRSEIEQKLEACQVEFQRNKSEFDSVHGILGQLNSLNNELQKIGDNIETEKPPQKMTDTSDYPGNV